MKKNCLVGLFCIFLTFSLIAQNAFAQDVDYTDMIVNNSFEYAWEGQSAQSGIDGWYNNTWRPWRASDPEHQKFYGWDVTDWNFKSSGNNSQSLESAAAPRDLSFNIAIFGDQKFDELWELYQVINGLPAGVYKVQALLASKAERRTSQRLFANQSVQYYGAKSDYASNKTEGEIATFAGYNAGNNDLKEMAVFTTIGEGEPLKIGIRTGGKKPDGTMSENAGDLWGQFKADHFRLTKINDFLPYSRLVSLEVNDLVLIPSFSPEVTNYTVYVPKKMTVMPVATAPFGSEVKGDEPVSLTEGTGVSLITVTAPDGTTAQTYTITYIENNAVDCTLLIVNNSFEYAWEGQPINSSITADQGWSGGANDTWKPKLVKDGAKEFYGWICDLDILTGESQGVNKEPINKNGDFAVWIGSSGVTWGANWEFYQTIDKEKLEAGTYKVQCRLAMQNAKRTSQRLFANNNVQYYGKESQYVFNLTEGEINTFAGWESDSYNDLKEMFVYTTIADSDSLKIGIRMGDRKSDGTLYADAASPMFKLDYFRVMKLDPADAANADLSGITLTVGVLNFVPEVTSYNVTLPGGTSSVTATATAALPDVKVEGAGDVDVSSGFGVTNIRVIALDGSTTKTYTINYVVDDGTVNLNELQAKAMSYKITNGLLTVNGVEAYTVYNINGVKIADVKETTASVHLMPGMYIVKAKNAGVLKVIVR